MRELLIGDVFRNAARAVPDRPAVIFEDEGLTFGQLDAAANHLARALIELGVGPGDTLAVWSPTRLALAPLFAAAAKVGVVYVPVNASLGAAEAAVIVSSSKARWVVTAEGGPSVPGDPVAPTGTRSISLDELGERASRLEGTDVLIENLSEQDPHVVFFTSGSSGRPKGAVISHRTSFLRSHPGALLEQRGIMVCPYPLFHMAAFTIALQQWQARDGVVFLPSADAPTICRAIEDHKAARVNCVPAVWRRILSFLDDATPPPDLSSLRFADTGTSATPPELLAAMARACPDAQIRVFYGSTEAGSVASLEHADIGRKPGSCGVPAPLTEVMIAATGELRVRGPLLFDGYLDDDASGGTAPDGTGADGWYGTGDLAERDDEGYLTITGRLGEVIRTGGEAVTPAEVEAALAGHPAVDDVAVIGLPDPQWGELVCAAVVPAPGSATPTVTDLRRFLEGRLASFKHPRRVVEVGAVPRTASTLQVQRRLLLEEVLGRD